MSKQVNKAEICVKCEMPRYIDSKMSGLIDTFAVRYLEAQVITFKQAQIATSSESLCVTCSRCGYSWSEPCADAKKEESKP